MREFRLTKKGQCILFFEMLAKMLFWCLLYFLQCRIVRSRGTAAYAGGVLALFFDPGTLMKAELLCTAIVVLLLYALTIRGYFYKKKNYFIAFDNERFMSPQGPKKQRKSLWSGLWQWRMLLFRLPCTIKATGAISQASACAVSQAFWGYSK
jgi:hypothetical protein